MKRIPLSTRLSSLSRYCCAMRCRAMNAWLAVRCGEEGLKTRQLRISQPEKIRHDLRWFLCRETYHLIESQWVLSLAGGQSLLTKHVWQRPILLASKRANRHLDNNHKLYHRINSIIQTVSTLICADGLLDFSAIEYLGYRKQYRQNEQYPSNGGRRSGVYNDLNQRIMPRFVGVMDAVKHPDFIPIQWCPVVLR